MMTSKKCYVLGNGPSLANVDNELIHRLHVFGSNRIYLKLVPDYYVCVNRLIAEQSMQQINAMQCEKFINYAVCPAGAHPLYSLASEFSHQPLVEVYEGGTVTVVMLQLALWFGYNTVYLLGVDHNYMSSGDANQEIIWTGNDVNHFSLDYMKDGEKWNCPDLYSSEQSYMLCKETYERCGAKIINVTEGSKLDVFPKQSLFDSIISTM